MKRRGFTPVKLPAPNRRERRAFTLVELLVVVGIIGLLVAVLVPQLSVARSLARSAVCQSNLHQFAGAFHGWAGEGKVRRLTRYPESSSWPGVAREQLRSDQVLLCPEDSPGAWTPLGNWTVTTPYGGGDGRTPGRFTIYMEPPSWGAAKRPAADGSYIDYVFEDGPGIITDPTSWGYDGTFRLTSTAGGCRIELKYRTCSEDNRSYFEGAPLFPGYGDIRIYNIPVGTYVIVAGSYCSYGINSQVARHDLQPDTIVVLDWDTKGRQGTTVDPAAGDTPDRLCVAGRHLGKLNVLRADDSIGRVGPTQINPQINPDVWQP